MPVGTDNDNTGKMNRAIKDEDQKVEMAEKTVIVAIKMCCGRAA